jgi:putative N6-adenine-specific DNA methylase
LNSDIFNHSNYPSLVLKDAIADYFKEKYYKRPNINTDQPTARFNIHISQDQANIALDTTGDGLFKRGYRDKMNEAPINEVIAAGLIKLSDWDKKTDFLDPMCGAGTVLIEAAMDLLDIPSGYWREHWAFMNANDFKMKEWEAFKAQYKWEAKSKVKIYGRDLSARTVKLIANPNVNRTGLSDVIKLSKQDFFKSEEQDREYHICSNPPYDERLKLEDGIKFYEEIGTTLKFKYKGSKAAIVSNHEEGMKRIGLKADHKYEIQNVNLKFKVNTYSVSK